MPTPRHRPARLALGTGSIGGGPWASGSLAVGPGASVDARQLVVGFEGAGSLLVRGAAQGATVGGAVTVGSTLTLGHAPGSRGSASVSGAGATLEAGTGIAVLVGRGGQGELLVTRGGAFRARYDVQLGNGGDSSGSVLVADAGSSATVGGTLAVNGRGSLDVLFGGRADANAVFVGGTPAAPAVANVWGAGALLRSANPIRVGYDGGSSDPYGTLKTAEGGTVVAPSVVVGRNGVVDVRPRGTLDVGLVDLRQGAELRLPTGRTAVGSDVHNAGRVTIDPGGVAAFSGRVDGTGTIAGNAEFGGTVTTLLDRGATPPNTSAAHIEGDARFGPTATLSLRLGRTLPRSGPHPVPGVPFADRLDVDGLAEFGGTLSAPQVFGIDPLPGDLFEVVRYGSHAGEFGRVVTSYGRAGLWFDAVYGPDALTLVADALPGDADLNGVVSLADVRAAVGHFGAAGDWLAGDFDRDGRIDGADLSLLLENFGRRVDGGPAASAGDRAAALAILGRFGVTSADVPEPVAAGWVGAAALALAGSRSRRRRP